MYYLSGKRCYVLITNIILYTIRQLDDDIITRPTNTWIQIATEWALYKPNMTISLWRQRKTIVTTHDSICLRCLCRISTGFLSYLGEVCVSFWYHMYGRHIGVLSVFKRAGATIQTEFSVAGDQGNRWRHRNETVFLNSGSDEVCFAVVWWIQLSTCRYDHKNRFPYCTCTLLLHGEAMHNN